MHTLSKVLFKLLLIVLISIPIYVTNANSKTEKRCYDSCTKYDENNKCTKTEKVCYEIIIEETDIITRDLTSPTQSCASADGGVYKCN